jgi:hypothetical protein
MAYTKVMTTALTGGKSVYTSEILTNKFTELQNSGDVVFTNETLEDSTARTTQVWRDEAAYNSFISWLSSSGELARMQAYHVANNITPTIS